MSLGHVYIVLEPVGSTCLTFDDDRYYEFMCFDVPKVVRSPGYDHGHDEESRNGQDIKIDILEGYVWTPEWLWVCSGIYRSTGGLPEPPGESMGLSGREEEATKWRVRPQEGNPTRNPSPSRFPPKGREGEGRRGRGERKTGAPPPSPIRTQGGGGSWPALAASLSLSPLRPIEAH